ncbi:MAG: aspartate aminotransferase family protein [Fimbriimonadaceae bacterium]|nr:aspartate aminotransferase family protein [Fimbriimonadaceae bacterium]
MNLSEHQQLDETYLLQNYGRRLPLAFVSGDGCYLYDSAGRRYLDWLAGIAVNTLGYAHPQLTAALTAQIGALLHSSNYFLIEPQIRLGQRLVELSGLDRAFFCNSGCEANEALLKFARLWNGAQVGEGRRTGVLAFEGSFHGRTLATLSATGQAKIQKGLAPLVPGFQHVPFNDLAAARAAVDDSIGAVLVETIQGEGGIHVATPEFLVGLRQLCDERGILLLLDEVQCGLGRTGSFFAYQQYGLQPDALALAKGLGGGVPIGAVVMTQAVADCVTPGTHGTTFGGNYLASRAGLTVVETMLAEDLVAHAASVGERLLAGLQQLAATHPLADHARGRGLMLALELTAEKAAAVRDACAERGLILNAVSPTALRILPPLVLRAEQVDEGLALLNDALAAV